MCAIIIADNMYPDPIDFIIITTVLKAIGYLENNKSIVS